MDALLPWFQLKSVPGIGNLLFRRLIEAFGGPRRALGAPEAALARVAGMNRRLAQAVRNHRLADAVRREPQAARAAGFDILTQADADYPPLLLQIPDPPPLLYVHGTLADCPPAVAVVGSRNPTGYGRTAARRLAAELAAAGLLVVSGMARGIDTFAHHGALEAGGRTVAVLGSGLERIYPAENRSLSERIAGCGAVISEYPLDAAPEAHHFPARNRIISGMSLGTLVVEASRRSGSLITARLAAEQNREVFAVPGSVHSFKSTGTHTLIKQGARLVEHARDVLEELYPGFRPPPVATPPASASPARLTGDQARVLAALEAYPLHIDELSRRLSIEAGKLAGILLELELLERVRPSAGKYFTRVGP